MTKENYREIYLILDKLGPNYIKKIPKSIYNYIKLNMSTKNESNATVSKETIAFIAGLHYRYWTEGEEEKRQLIKIFNENQKIKDEKMYPDKLIKNKEKVEKAESVQLIKAEKWYTKIFRIFKRIFRIGDKNC